MPQGELLRNLRSTTRANTAAARILANRLARALEVQIGDRVVGDRFPSIQATSTVDPETAQPVPVLKRLLPPAPRPQLLWARLAAARRTSPGDHRAATSDQSSEIGALPELADRTAEPVAAKAALQVQDPQRDKEVAALAHQSGKQRLQHMAATEGDAADAPGPRDAQEGEAARADSSGTRPCHKAADCIQGHPCSRTASAADCEIQAAMAGASLLDTLLWINCSNRCVPVQPAPLCNEVAAHSRHQSRLFLSSVSVLTMQLLSNKFQR